MTSTLLWDSDAVGTHTTAFPVDGTRAINALPSHAVVF